MEYLAVLGREKELSLAELESVSGVVTTFGDCALTGDKPDINRLGGVIKLAKVISRLEWRGLDNLELDTKHFPAKEGKTIVGVSFYGPKVNLKPWALELKKKLKTKGSIRIVVDENPLSAAQLKFNQVLSKGSEIIIAVSDKEVVVALTEAVQDIDWYSRRDYDRPMRSAKVGMLPPKLAQTMINLSGGEKIYDAFCGTGVVLQEALLMDKPAQGSDIEPKMIEYTEANLKWLASQVDHKLPDFTVDVADARTVKLPVGFSVVSEGYLGPALNKPPTDSELVELKAELTDLYAQSLVNWSRQLEPGTRICLAIPCWKMGGKFETLPLIDQIEQIGYNLVRFKHADSRKLIYARPDQIVGRQLLVLEKK